MSKLIHLRFRTLARPALTLLMVAAVILVTLAVGRPSAAHASTRGGYIFRAPHGAQASLAAAAGKVIDIKQVAFTSDGKGWIILYDFNGYSADGLPTEMTDKLDSYNADGIEIKSLAFTPDGNGWIIIAAPNAFSSTGLPDTALSSLSDLNGQGSELMNITFNADGEWIILYDTNHYEASKNFPTDVTDKMDELIKQLRTLKKVVFDANGNWAILYNENRFFGHSLDKALNTELKQFQGGQFALRDLAFSADGTWVILYGVNGSIWAKDTLTPLTDRLKELNKGKA